MSEIENHAAVPFRSGFAALLGKPNAGKSTLLNRLIGAKIAAVSALPQTTRERFHGIYNDDHRQIVFVDLPGMMEPTDRLNECLKQNVLDGLQDVDVVIHLVDVQDSEPVTTAIAEAFHRISTPIILVVNKLDGKRARTDAGSWAGENMTAEHQRRYAAVAGVSAWDGRGVEKLVHAVGAFLPEGPPLYDPEILTDRDLRYLAQELIREKAFTYLHQELPYSTAVEIEEFKEREGAKWYIRAVIFVERDSQKGMVIGKKGEMLKKISTAARKEIEVLCDAPVYLELFVKVLPKWRTRDTELKRFGFNPP